MEGRLKTEADNDMLMGQPPVNDARGNQLQAPHHIHGILGRIYGRIYLWHGSAHNLSLQQLSSSPHGSNSGSSRDNPRQETVPTSPASTTREDRLLLGCVP